MDEFLYRFVSPGRATETAYDFGRILSAVVEFGDEEHSEWAQSKGSRQWTVGVAELAADDQPFGSASPGEKLVGVLSPSPALNAGLISNLEEFLDSKEVAHERASFSLRALLGSQGLDAGLRLRSIRLRSDDARILVQSDSERALMENVSAVDGEVVGVTAATKESR